MRLLIWLPYQLTCVARPTELYHIFPYSRPVEMTQDLVNICLTYPQMACQRCRNGPILSLPLDNFLGQQFGMLSPILE